MSSYNRRSYMEDTASEQIAIPDLTQEDRETIDEILEHADSGNPEDAPVAGLGVNAALSEYTVQRLVKDYNQTKRNPVLEYYVVCEGGKDLNLNNEHCLIGPRCSLEGATIQFFMDKFGKTGTIPVRKLTSRYTVAKYILQEGKDFKYKEAPFGSTHPVSYEQPVTWLTSPKCVEVSDFKGTELAALANIELYRGQVPQGMKPIQSFVRRYPIAGTEGWGTILLGGLAILGAWYGIRKIIEWRKATNVQYFQIGHTPAEVDISKQSILYSLNCALDSAAGVFMLNKGVSISNDPNNPKVAISKADQNARYYVAEYELKRDRDFTYLDSRNTTQTGEAAFVRWLAPPRAKNIVTRTGIELLALAHISPQDPRIQL